MTNAWEMEKALLIQDLQAVARERDLAKQVAEEAMKMLTDEQLTALREILDEGGYDGSNSGSPAPPAQRAD